MMEVKSQMTSIKHIILRPLEVFCFASNDSNQTHNFDIFVLLSDNNLIFCNRAIFINRVIFKFYHSTFIESN